MLLRIIKINKCENILWYAQNLKFKKNRKSTILQVQKIW